MRILVAEDDRTLSRALLKILERANYSADAVENGEDAQYYLTTGQYDGAILDVMMPKKDGLSVLREVRRMGIDLPVIILSAKSELEDRVRGLDGGANYYLTKPFAMEELLAALRAVTRPARAEGALLQYGNVTLNLSDYTLNSPFGSVRLANKEFQMMEMLLSQPKRLISTEHFLEKIWGWDTECEPSVVWVYISYLRKRLKTLGANVAIRASRNAGYSLEELV